MNLISETLRLEIKNAINNRLSVEVILEDAAFKGTAESVEELVQYLIEVMGNRMTLEFMFSSQAIVWDEYRKLLSIDAWKRLSTNSNFISSNYLMLGEDLIQRDKIESGRFFLEQAVSCSLSTRELVDICEVVFKELSDSNFIKETLESAKGTTKTSEDLSMVAEAYVNFLDDEDIGRKLFTEAVSKGTKSSDYSDASLAILKSLKDVEWAKDVFAQMKTAPQSGTPLEMLAEEEFNGELAQL